MFTWWKNSRQGLDVQRTVKNNIANYYFAVYAAFSHYTDTYVGETVQILKDYFVNNTAKVNTTTSFYWQIDPSNGLQILESKRGFKWDYNVYNLLPLINLGYYANHLGLKFDNKTWFEWTFPNTNTNLKTAILFVKEGIFNRFYADNFQDVYYRKYFNVLSQAHRAYPNDNLTKLADDLDETLYNSKSGWLISEFRNLACYQG